MKLIRGGLLVAPEGVRRADIAVEGEAVAAVGQAIAPGPGDEVIDAEGCLVFPGFIDAHTHLDMDTGAAVTADDFASGTRAAIAGGTTAIVDFATQRRGASLSDALAAWHEKADGRCYADYGFHMAITDWNRGVRAQLGEMMASGVTTFKLYMAYDALRLADDQIYDILSAAKAVGGLVYCHCENGPVINLLIERARLAKKLGPAQHPRCRPALLEAEAVSRFSYLAQQAGAPAGVVHLSSRAGLREALRARARGVALYLETCPQYLLLDDSRYEEPGFGGAKYVCSPPLRGKADVRALREAVRRGQIDTIATDHCSFTLAQKALGREDFSKIPNGLPGIEHRPALIYSELVAKGLIGPSDMCRLLSENPARRCGLYPKKGTLQPGADADIVLWDGDAKWVLRSAEQHMLADYSPYEGLEITGRPRQVLLRGQTAFRDGRVFGPAGRWLPRGRPAL